jgi:galactokinase
VAFVDTQELTLDDLDAARGPGWFAYIAGVVWAAQQEGHELRGIDMVIDGDLPVGSGLSSSAALEMATLRALCEVSDIPWRPREMARIGQRAENDFVGVSSGLMDQLACAVALPGCALLLDCRSLDTQDIPMPKQAAIVVMDTGAPRTLAASAYNDRRQSCERAVEILRAENPEIHSLRDADQTMLEAARSQMDDTTYHRALHVIEENRRPEALAAALQSQDLATAGRLMDNSHASLRDLYEVSSHELNLITELAREHPACFGARLTGAGFGGSAIALVEADGAEEFSLEVYRAYHSRVDLASQFFVCKAAGGARLLDPVTLE